jgi:hypothetical protein
VNSKPAGSRRLIAVRALIAAFLTVVASHASASAPLMDAQTIVNARAANAAAASAVDMINDLADSPDVQVFRVVVAEVNEPSLSHRRHAFKLALNDASGPIAVIYPDIGEPYRSVFEKIIQGIEDRAGTPVVSYAVGGNPNLQQLALELKRQDVKVLIALGRNGLKAATDLNLEIGIVASGVLSAPEAQNRLVSVFSLAPDPALLFSRLKSLQPSTRRIHVVFDPRQNAWLMRYAREAARANGMELVSYEASDLKTAVGHYREILATADPKRDALWLPQDTTTVEESTVLPLVLQESWNRGLTVFSSSVAHVKRGVLFSLYPNNVELGRDLAGYALSHLSAGSGSGRGVVPLREVLQAVNLRTAGHLGLDVSLQPDSYDMVFPEP